MVLTVRVLNRPQHTATAYVLNLQPANDLGIGSSIFFAAWFPNPTFCSCRICERTCRPHRRTRGRVSVRVSLGLPSARCPFDEEQQEGCSTHRERNEAVRHYRGRPHSSSSGRRCSARAQEGSSNTDPAIGAW